MAGMAKSPAYWAVWGPAYREALSRAQAECTAALRRSEPTPWLGGTCFPRRGPEGRFVTPAGGDLSPGDEARRLAAAAAHAEAAAASVAHWSDDKTRRFGSSFAACLPRATDA